MLSESITLSYDRQNIAMRERLYHRFTLITCSCLFTRGGNHESEHERGIIRMHGIFQGHFLQKNNNKDGIHDKIR
jgi:hypothetical protein